MISHQIGMGPTSTGKVVEVTLGRRSWGRCDAPATASSNCGGWLDGRMDLRRAMQDFEFRVYGSSQAAPSVMFILTRDEHSARTMAERTLGETNGCSHIDVWVTRRYLFTVEAPDSVARQGVSDNSTVSPSSFWSAFRK